MRKKFSTIVADPPWNYGTGAIKGSINLENHYSTLSVEQICSIDVSSVAADNAHLYLWTTNAFMVEAHAIAESWGFTPKTILTWVKTKKKNPAEPSMRCGYWYRGATEHMLFCVKGRLRLKGKQCRPTAYLSQRLPHSVKPEWSYQLIEEQSFGPYLEMFSRRKRVGWCHWGNEVVSDVEMKGIPPSRVITPQTSPRTAQNAPYSISRVECGG